MSPSMNDLALRLRGARFATQADLDDLVALEHTCFPTRAPRRPLSFVLYPTIMVVANLVPVDESMPLGTITARMAHDAPILGYASMSIAQSVAFLWDSAVAPAARRRGLASALLAERMRLAILMNCKILTGGLAAENAAMRKLHEDTGWTIEYKPTDDLATPIPVHTWSTNPVTLAWLTRQYGENPWLRPV